jgi:hypothetical protein
VRTIPTLYESNKKAWMTTELFKNWLIKYSVAKNVAKIVDNCRAHPNVKGLKTTEFVFLPPNTTGHTQPMDQGITKIQKSHYKKQGHLETTSSS